MLKYTITKQFTFSAGHYLTKVPPDHPCHRPHGHNYIVEVELSSDVLDFQDMVVDYRQLESLKQYLQGLDHQMLNDVLTIEPTAENLAELIYNYASIEPWGDCVVAVRVRETEKTCAEVRYVSDP